ncbi:hypothetical protein C8R44DRAFT_945474 [Mycena epipterygia]|nr:hypothetical protein C8R44DRAFT_945474 [Mycena epipterygia]
MYLQSPIQNRGNIQYKLDASTRSFPPTAMRFLSTCVVALAGLVAAAPNAKRSVVEPTASTSITSGESIPFNYVDSNWCHAGYSPITIWLSASAPTGVNSTGGLPEGTYIEYFGEFLIANFGLTPMQPVPPTSLTIPDISSHPAGSTLFLSVVETAPAGTCPPVRAIFWIRLVLLMGVISGEPAGTIRIYLSRTHCRVDLNHRSMYSNPEQCNMIIVKMLKWWCQ